MVSKLPELQNPLDFDSYVELVEKLLNHEPDRFLKIAFDVFDFNQDKLICELDTYTQLQTFQGPETEEVFMQAFSFDLCLIGGALKKKQGKVGIKDFDIYTKLQTI